MVSNRRIISNHGNDFYPTPDWATEALISNENFKGDIYECACGVGSMSEILKKSGCNVISSDIEDRGYGDKIDFLNSHQKFDNIVTNPPYNLAEDFIHKALSLSHHKVAMLLRLAFLEGVGRHKRLYKENSPNRILVFSERVTFYPHGENNKKSGGTTAYAWFIWDKKELSKETKISWFPPNSRY